MSLQLPCFIFTSITQGMNFTFRSAEMEDVYAPFLSFGIDYPEENPRDG